MTCAVSIARFLYFFNVFSSISMKERAATTFRLNRVLISLERSLWDGTAARLWVV
jgi:hypothetical protein